MSQQFLLEAIEATSAAREAAEQKDHLWDALVALVEASQAMGVDAERVQAAQAKGEKHREDPRRLYSFYEDWGRMGAVEARFNAHPDFMARVLSDKPSANLGEILGKHSEVRVTLSEETVTEIGPADEKQVYGPDILEHLQESTVHPDEVEDLLKRWPHLAPLFTWDDWARWVGYTE